MLAHELRNPLAPIRNAVEIQKRANTDSSRIIWCTDIIDRQLIHLTRLLDDLLDVSRISRGVVELRKDILEIQDFIQPAIETSQTLINTRRQELSMTLPPEPVWVEGDRIRLTQVMLNLINNAAKYTQEGGHIRLTIEPAAEKVCIRVSDNGCGMDPTALPYLFNLFYQVDRNLDHSRSGLGIGLSLVHGLVELHGGDVRAFSAGQGQGSEFVVCLPRLINPKPAPVPTPTHATSTAALNKLGILVVEDNCDVADSLALLLEMDGHQVRKAYDSKIAIEMVDIQQPDVILLDIGLPGMDGYLLAQALRQNSKLQRTLLIALTGYGQPEDKEKSRAAGFDEHLVKPLDYEILQKLLNDHRATAFQTKK
jgi:CheY-like chemotaxis protein